MPVSEPKPEFIPLSNDVWAVLTPTVQALLHANHVELVFLRSQLAEQQGQLAKQQGQLAEQKKKLRELEARLNENSSNSSRPPSSDPPWTKKYPKQRRKRGKKRGAQPGHRGSRRETVPPEKVTHFVDHRPGECEKCGADLSGASQVGRPQRRQVWDLPPIEPEIIEHRLHGALCSCGHVTHAQIPGEAKYGTGPRLTSLIAMLCGRYRISRQEAADLVTTVLGIPVCKGTAQACCERVSEALAKPVAELSKALPEMEMVHMDETGWREAGRRMWLWVASTSLFVLFMVHPSRGQAILRDWFGTGFMGIVSSDRFSTYQFFDVQRRQICWSHLLRDLQGIADAGGQGAESAKKMLKQAKDMFTDWHALKADELSREQFIGKTAPFREAFQNFCARGAAQDDDTKWRGLSNNLTKLWPAVFLFVDTEGVEPTNNESERMLRPSVLWRRSSQGTRSPAGSLFVSRILTTAATCNRQHRPLLQYLERAVKAWSTGRSPPSLLTEPG